MNISIYSNFGAWPLLRQLNPDQKIHQFLINDLPPGGTDICIIYDDIIAPTEVVCGKGGLWLFTAEPEPMKKYSKRYLQQFDLVVTSQEGIRHPNVKYQQTALPWHLGLSRDGQGYKNIFTYSDLKKSPVKSKLISMIVSNKKYTSGHKQRLKFAEAMKNHFGDRLEVFGRGIKDFADKKEIIDPYQYHIVLENSSYRDYWTEKLADAYLGEAFPFYYGSPNIDQYFDKESYIPIDIYKYDESIRAIEAAIGQDLSTQRKGQISDAKKLVMDKYNLFSEIENLAQSIHVSKEKRKSFLNPEINSKNLFEKADFYFDAMVRRILEK